MCISGPGHSRTILIHLFAGGFEGERYVVERFQAMSEYG